MPPLKDDQLGPLSIQNSRSSEPGHRVKRIDDRFAVFGQRLFAEVVLGNARKQYLRILPAQGQKQDFVSLPQRPNKQTRVVSNPPPEGVRQPDNGNPDGSLALAMHLVRCVIHGTPYACQNSV